MPNGQMPEEHGETRDWEEQKEASTAQQQEDPEETKDWEEDKQQDNNDAQ